MKTPTATPSQAPKTAVSDTDALPDGVTAGLEVLQRSLVLQRERVQEIVDDAVRRGRMTKSDAEDLVQSLVLGGRRQAEDLLAEMERFVGRGRKEVETAARQARKRTVASPVTREVDRARGRLGAPGFPITGYDDLTAAQVVERLADLRPAQLRKVRDYERRNANRKGVLRATEKALA